MSDSFGGNVLVYQAKLRPAVNPEYLVRRPRLIELLDTAVESPLTLVVAPAGSGKTSLLRDWVGWTDLPNAWLSVDESDRDPAQLWLSILAALDGIAPGCAEPAADLVRRRHALLDAVGTLLDDLESRRYGPRVLVIDDLEVVDEAVAGGSLTMFVQHLPRWLRVVLVSRHVPALPVDRLRARGMLGEVRFPELRFSFDEATEMLARLAPTLPPQRVAKAARHAGGWAASIQLAALAARSADARAGPDAPQQDEVERYLGDYVWHEVLSGEPADVVDVLVAVSVVDRAEPGLARALAGRLDAPILLERAEERGLFAARIEPSGAYETHALVREALLSDLRRREPERVTELHRRAAQWFEDAGQPVAALEHLLRAGEVRAALRLLASCVPELYDSGREVTVRRMLAAIPAGTAVVDTAAAVDLAWCQLFADRNVFVQTVHTVVARADGDGAVEPCLLARLEMLRAASAAVSGDWGAGARSARWSLATIGDRWQTDPLCKFGWNLLAREIALAERWDDAGPEVRQIARTLGPAPGRRIAFEATRALGAALAGRPVEALRLVYGTRQVSEAANLTTARTELMIAEALANREIGEQSAALPVLSRLVETPCDPVPHCRLLACLELARAAVDSGDGAAAERAFGDATELVDTELTGPGSRTLLARTGTLLALAESRLDDAGRWAAEVDDPFWGGVETARVLIAEGDVGTADTTLRAAAPRCVRHHVLLDLLLSRTTRNADEAEAALSRAVRLAAEHGLVQTVASEGTEVVEAIERLAWQVPRPWLDRLRRVPLSGASPPGTAVVELVEDLTDRQLGILRMLPSRLSLREIADELFISVNTLKFHLKVIYRKLGCGSRAEAADLARALMNRHRRGQPSGGWRR
ncbi:LuxR C-terminal-related transcriptional regulator [Promicromonospora sp. MEB111]|uniref:helix-turn-helix transcriptional regulator n=1 Tax=Promicromonospora sp. MEB111 TaxID=3040301 RepID=UPI00254D6086|nr:LuxR C-terminal-related transcriptional regulator [Promicromonospora sp. MEB111]